MASDGPGVARGFLTGRPGAVRQVQGWVRLAAAPFRRRLADDWEDAVHEALLEVTEALRGGAVRDLGRLRAWVFRTTAHTCLDRLRARSRWSWVEADEVRLASPPSALSRLLARGEVRTLLDLAARSPEPCRRLWRWLLQGLSYREMSERSGLAEGTLRVRVLRCRRQAQALAEELAAAEAAGRSVTKQRPERPGPLDGNDHGL